MNDDPPYDGVDEDCDGSNDYDADRDGFVSKDHGGNDCNDDDANVHPGLSDQSPSVDVDCDGTAEDAAGTIRFVRQDCGANDPRDASFLLLAPLLAWRRRGR
jgi:hypothetical protein